MHVTQWKEPALNWNGAVAEDGRASILEIRSDQFIPEFLQAMGSKNPAGYFEKHRIDDDSGSLKLYQPLHGCFYLVTASLVCRQLGLPDKAVNRAAGESVFFVIRRRTAGGDEEAWIPSGKSGRWQLLADDAALTLALGEERLPMHPVKICPKPETPHSVFTDNVERDLYYGYIPTGNRDKYKDTVGRIVSPGVNPAVFVNDFINQVEDEAPASENYSFRKDIFFRRVYLPWNSLRQNLDEDGGVIVLKTQFGTDAQTEQLYVILELGEFLKNNLPTFWDALEAGDDSSLPTAMADLYNHLTAVQQVKSGGSDEFLGDVVLQFKNHFNLIRGQGEIPATDFDFRNVSEANLNTLRTKVEAAVAEETAPIELPGGENSELFQLISNQVQPRPDSEPFYHIRTVYEYDPDCPPVVSRLATRPFQLTKFFEPGAPARLVRLEAPSIKPKDLRSYARGVGIEMSPELHKLASCMGGEDMDGVISSIESCQDNDGGLSIQMICSFSIQIIFLVAFIVMFIFLISLNFVFWWLAYLRICLPIPKKS